MIGYVTGTVSQTTKNTVLVMVGSLGFEIQVPNSATFQTGETISLYTYMHWNQEQGPSLFGFLSLLEKSVFLLAIQCSGIGPKVGLTIIAELGASAFVRAIQKGDERVLSSVSGIGPKKAEHIIVQLKHKIDHVMIADMADDTVPQWHLIAQALESLKYSKAEIARVLHYLRSNQEQHTTTSFDYLLRHALSFLSKQV